MGWLGWLFLLAGLYVVVVAVRGGIQLVSWFIDEYIVEPRAIAHPKDELPQRPHEQDSAPRAKKVAKAQGQADHKNGTSRAPVQDVAAMLSTSHSGGLRWRLKTLFFRRDYGFWVAAALSEEDRERKVGYLSKALRLNPAYLPAWGMKGNALLDLGRYQEAEPCFDRSLEIHPSAMVWYKKGRCCHHGGRREEALRCLAEALKMCPSQDRQLLDDVTRMRSLVEDELRFAKSP